MFVSSSLARAIVLLAVGVCSAVFAHACCNDDANYDVESGIYRIAEDSDEQQLEQLGALEAEVSDSELIIHYDDASGRTVEVRYEVLSSSRVRGSQIEKEYGH